MQPELIGQLTDWLKVLSAASLGDLDGATSFVKADRKWVYTAGTQMNNEQQVLASILSECQPFSAPSN